MRVIGENVKAKGSHPHEYATLQLILGATMISFSAVFVKLAHVGPTMAGFYRMFFGGLVLLIITLLQRNRIWFGRRLFFFTGACAFFFALDLTFWHRSIHAVGPGLSTILANFQVFFLTAYGLLIIKERPGWKFFAAIPLALIGLFMIVGIKWSHLSAGYKTGVVFGILTAFCYASYLLTLRRLQSDKTSPQPMASIAAISLITALIMGIESGIQKESFRIPDSQSWVALILYGLAGQVLGWVLISHSIPKIPASRVGLILLLQPILSFAWDILFFARPTGSIEIAGAILAVSAIYLGSSKQQS